MSVSEIFYAGLNTIIHLSCIIGGEQRMPNIELRDRDIISVTARIVVGYVSTNVISRAELPKFIAQTFVAFKHLDQRPNERETEANQLPAVPIQKSIYDDYLVSLEDGRQFRSLRRHLMSTYGLTPAMYRAKWGLPRDYPMVAPNFAAERSVLSKATWSSNQGHEPSTEGDDMSLSFEHHRMTGQRIPRSIMTHFSMDIEMAADLLSAMGNEKRLLVLDILSREETSVGKLAVMANIGQSALSQHLAKLKSFKLVHTRRDAQTIYYRSDSEEVRKLLATLYEIYEIDSPLAGQSST